MSQSLNGTWYHIIRVQLLFVHGFVMSHIKLFQPVSVHRNQYFTVSYSTLHIFLRSSSLGIPFTSIAVFIVSYAHIQWFWFANTNSCGEKYLLALGCVYHLRSHFFRAYLIILLKCKMARFSNRRPLFLLYTKVRQ